MKKILPIILILCISVCLIGCNGCVGCKTPEEAPVVDPALKAENETLKIHCYNLVNMNPLDNLNEENIQMLSLIYESLFVCDSTQKAQPLLAENYSVSADGLTWNITLKNNIKWHDGTPLSASDVVYTYNYVMSNATSYFYPNVANIKSVTSVSDYEVCFGLHSPQANFVNLLEVPIVKNGSTASASIGTGPYTYQKTENKIIYLAANESWHKGAVGIKNIQSKILPDKETATYAYISKETDMVSVNSGNEMGKYTSNSDNVIKDYPSNKFTFIGINTNSEPLSNRLFRKAIAHAIDKDTINSQVLLSHGSVANSCMNSNWWVYNPAVTIYEHSNDKAVNVLNEVTKTMKLSEITLLINNENPDKEKVAEIIKQNLADCGITMHIEIADWQTYSDRIASGNYQMYLGTIEYSSEINPKYVVTNPGPELQSLFIELQSQTTEEGIRKKYYDIQEKIAIDIHMIPLYFDVGAVLYNKRIQGEATPYRASIFNGIANLTLTE
ncbi:MAG: ABC transporter substrate-binding protein [Clostridia bacterium]|nr:ABC transporter substrate-binding protein [Clostridia bacterium]